MGVGLLRNRLRLLALLLTNYSSSQGLSKSYQGLETACYLSAIDGSYPRECEPSKGGDLGCLGLLSVVFKCLEQWQKHSKHTENTS